MSSAGSLRHVPQQAGTLETALDLLRLVLNVVRSELPPEARERISLLLASSKPRVLDESELPTFVERPRLCAVSLSLNQFRVLERALCSPRLQGTFGDLHDFMLVAARGYPYAPAPVFEAEASNERRIIAFTKAELDELQPRALEVGIHEAGEFVVGCAFHWLQVLAEKWPDDEALRFNTHATEPAVVHYFGARP